jgi:WD40 repeat protein/beta-lactamase regulating signal transducer with metallopeptidase domain
LTAAKKEPSMSPLVAIVVANAVSALVLAIPAYLVSRSGRRPALAHALWLLVLLKLVTPPLFRPALPWLPPEEEKSTAAVAPPTPAPEVDVPVALSLPPEMLLRDGFARGDRVAGAPAGLMASPHARKSPLLMSEPPSLSPAPPPPPPLEEKPEEAAEVEAPAAAAAEAPDLMPLLVLAWLIGAVVCLARVTLYTRRFHRLLVHARRAGAPVQEQAQALARQMGMKRCPQVWLVPGALPPMVWGVGPLRILFPAGLLDRLDHEERASLLAHELGHIARRDHWVRWLEILVLAVYWWYPLAWWARRQMQDREEECCDALAAAAVSARVYAGAILEAVDFLAESRPRLPAMASPLAAAQSLKQRLLLIMTGRTPLRLGTSTRLLLAALSIAVLPLLPVLTCAAKQQTPDKPTDNEAVAAPAGKVAAEEADLEPTEFLSSTINLVGGSDEVFSVNFSPDGKRIAAGIGNVARPGEVEVYDVRSRKREWTMQEMRGVSSVFFSHDSKRLGWSGFSGLLRVFDHGGRKNVYSLPLDANYRLSFSGDGRWMAAAGENGALRLYQAATGRLERSFRGDLPGYFCLNFSCNSELLAAGGGRFNQRAGGPNHALIYNIKTGKQVAKLEGHKRAVINVAFAPHDALIATASADSSVRVWDGKSYKLQRVLNGHTNVVKGLAFSPDGKTLATGSWDKTIRFWDPLTGKQTGQLDGHPDKVREIAFSPDGNLLVSGGALRSIKLWDVKKRKELATLRQDPVPPAPQEDAPPAAAQATGVSPVVLAVSPNGKVVATGSEAGPIQLLDSFTGRIRLSLKGHEDAATTLAFSHSGKVLASSGPDALIKLWDSSTGKELRTLKGHENWVFALTFAHDDKTLASGSYDKTVRVWDLDKPGAARVLKGHTASVRSLSFSPDDLLLASASTDRRVRVWDTRTLASKAVLKGHNKAVRGVAFSPDGRTLASVDEDGMLFLWDSATFKERLKIKAHTSEALSLAFSPKGRVLATGAQGGSICFWDPVKGIQRGKKFAHSDGVVDLAFGPGGRELYSLGGGKGLKRWQGTVSPVRYFDGHKGPVNGLAISPDGKYVLSCSTWPNGDNTARLWELATGKEVHQFKGNKNTNLQSVAFSLDGKYAVTGATDGVIWQWQTSTGKLVHSLKGHKDAVASLTFSADGKKLLSASHDKTLRLWNFASGETERTFTGHTDWARRAVFLPDGKHILSGGRDRVLRLWDLESGKLLRTIEHNKQWVESIAVTRDGKRILTGGGNALHLWNLSSGKLLRSFEGHVYGVTSVALLRDERTALSCSYDGSVRYWDVQSGVELQRYSSHRNYVWSVALLPDGKQFLSAGGGGQQGGNYVAGDDFAIRLWKLPQFRVALRP